MYTSLAQQEIHEARTNEWIQSTGWRELCLVIYFLQLRVALVSISICKIGTPLVLSKQVAAVLLKNTLILKLKI